MPGRDGNNHGQSVRNGEELTRKAYTYLEFNLRDVGFEGVPYLPSDLLWTYDMHVMDDKYNLRKSREPETKQEAIQREIEELVRRRDNISNAAEKRAIQAQIMKLFAQWERLKL